jgi:ketopantoate reductase
VAITEEDEARTLAFVASLPDPIKPSFLLDLEAEGPTEIDHLSGAVAAERP